MEEDNSGRYKGKRKRSKTRIGRVMRMDILMTRRRERALKRRTNERKKK